MKILLIMPDAHMHKFMLGPWVRSAREAPVTLTGLAALCSDEDVHYTLIDESVDAVPLDWEGDLVGISVMTGTSRRAYALADHFRARGLPVVLGGVHVKLMPDEARRFADSIVLGMADKTWPRLIADFRAGTMASEYHESEEDAQKDWVEGIPTPRWDLQRASGYMIPHTIQVTRGCIHRCDFCTVPAVWKRFQRRPVADVVADVKAMKGRRFVINDVSPFDDVDYAKELFSALIPLKKKWGGLATSRICDDDECFELMVRSGCQYLLIGFESVNQNALNGIGKGFNKFESYKVLVDRLQGNGVSVQGCFVFGFDHDGPDCFAHTVDLVQQLKIAIPRYSIYTPYPGTRLFQRLEKEGRILSYDWGDYDTMHVVFRPALMSPVQLHEGFRWAYRETFRLGKVFSRSLASGWRFPIVMAGNLTYNLFIRRLFFRKGFEMPLEGGRVDSSSMCSEVWKAPTAAAAEGGSDPCATCSEEHCLGTACEKIA